MTLVLMIFSLTIFAQTEKLQGKWISDSETSHGEMVAYEFDNNIFKMFYNGEELETLEPIQYKIIENNGRTEIEIEYGSALNNSIEKMYGLVEFLKNGKIKMEFFPFEEQKGKKNDFSEEALIFSKE